MKTIICNWKLNPSTLKEGQRLFEDMKKLAAAHKKVQFVVLPPLAFLYPLTKGYRGTRIEFGAQAVSSYMSGSHTGEVSVMHAKEVGAMHVLVGHAEQRAQGVTNTMTHAQVAAALAAKLDVILAVGEKTQDTHGAYINEIREQITTALQGVEVAQYKHITIAYEPVWAIGAPEAPKANAVHQMMLLVKKIVHDAYGEKALKQMSVVYGGSVDEHSAHEILALPDIDGVLVGRASLDAERLGAIARAAQ